MITVLVYGNMNFYPNITNTSDLMLSVVFNNFYKLIFRHETRNALSSQVQLLLSKYSSALPFHLKEDE